MSSDVLAGLLLLTIGLAGFGMLSQQRRLKLAGEARRAAESRLETLIEYAPIGLAVVDHDGRIRQANGLCRTLLGYRPEAMRSLDDWWRNAFPDENARAAAIETARQMTEQSRNTCAASGPQQLNVICADGAMKSIEFQYVDFGDVGLWTLIDITDHYRIEEAARLANDHLLTQLSENRRLQEALREQAIRDPLTTLFNRRYLDETLEREISRAIREGYPVAVLMIDIDHFKRLNDTYGHLAGDEVLKALAALLRASARHEDVICRFGGEEFAIVLPRMPLDVAFARAEGWRTEFAGTGIRFGEFELRATLSAGIAAFPDHGRARDALIDAADHALYRAKELGRNRSLIASNGTDQPTC
jgi:diguanylate cyclase (GGDEF)-like protein/PAS domain S-box-containing protein